MSCYQGHGVPGGVPTAAGGNTTAATAAGAATAAAIEDRGYNSAPAAEHVCKTQCPWKACATLTGLHTEKLIVIRNILYNEVFFQRVPTGTWPSACTQFIGKCARCTTSTANAGRGSTTNSKTGRGWGARWETKRDKMDLNEKRELYNAYASFLRGRRRACATSACATWTTTLASCPPKAPFRHSLSPKN